MNKKQLKINATTGWVLFGLAVIASAGLVFAYQGDSPKVVVEGDYIEAPEAMLEEMALGGSGGTFETKWYKVGNKVTYVESGTMRDATTTLLSIRNPFGSSASTTQSTTALEEYDRDFNGTLATSTVTSVTLDVPLGGSATTSMQITCGGATNAWTAPTYDLASWTIPTSTPGVFTNNIASTTGGFNIVGGGTTAKILLTHEYSYFNCHATGTPLSAGNWNMGAGVSGSNNGLIGTSNTWTGTYSVEIEKNLE